MRSSRISTVVPSLCTDGAQSGSREIPTAFPARHYPASFHAIGRRASTVLCALNVICLPCLFHLSDILGSSGLVVPRQAKNVQGLTGCLVDAMCRANGPPTPGLRLQLAMIAANDVAFRNAQALGRIQQIQNFGASASRTDSFHSSPRGHPRSIHPHDLSVYTSTFDFGRRSRIVAYRHGRGFRLCGSHRSVWHQHRVPRQ